MLHTQPHSYSISSPSPLPVRCRPKEEAHTPHHPPPPLRGRPISDSSEEAEEGVKHSVSEDLSTASARQILEQLAVALWYAVVSRSEMVAYIVVFINQVSIETSVS